MEEHSKNSNKNTVIGLKITLEGFNSKLDEAVEQTIKLQDKVIELTQTELQKRKKIFFKDKLRDLWENIMRYNFCITGIQDRKERQKKEQKTYLKK